MTITQRDFYNAILTGELVTKSKDENGVVTETSVSIFDENGVLIDAMKSYASERIAKLDDANKKRKDGSKPTKAQVANETIKDALFEAMEAGTTYTSADILELGVDGISTSQKVTALMKKLIAEDKVVASEVKKDNSKGKVKGYTKA